MKPAFDPLVLLRELAAEYRHVEQEHVREPPTREATRNRLAEHMQEIEARFERALAAWIADDALRARWRELLHARGPDPDAPHVSAPPLFRGRTDAGAIVELRAAGDGYDVFVDGVHEDHATGAWHVDPVTRGRVRIGELVCDELFSASPEAIAALTQHLAGNATTPARARELFEDGLIDAQLALTARGRRCLEHVRPEAPPPPAGTRNVCVVCADAARARILVLEVDRSSPDEPTSSLALVGALANPILRARDTELVSDSGPGRRRGARTPLRSTVDHRGHHRRELERHFAALVAEEAAAVWRRYPACDLVVIAPPVMLGLLRPAIERTTHGKGPLTLRELARDLTKLTVPMLHDALADAELIPPRGRRRALAAPPHLTA